MRSIVRTLFGAILVLMIACDPGMTIRQTEPGLLGTAPSKQQVTIHVRTSHPLIGERWYYPEVQVSNSSGSSIAITSVELAARGETYANEPRQSGIYPLVIQPGSTQTLDVRFRLGDAVKKVFKHSAELRARYRRGSTEETAHATIVGGPLDDHTP